KLTDRQNIIYVAERPQPLKANATTKDHGVDDCVDQDDEPAKCPLELARERGWIEDRQDVVLDEGRRVLRPPTLGAKPVFKRRQRTHPAGELDAGAPSRGRQMHPGD